MEDLILSFPFVKVDEARRVVTGIATADNIDPSGDIIDFNASQKAFSEWIGNIREMHKPDAVGKALSFRPVKVPHNGHVYDGIEVDAYISRGAESTWEKVLDGTLKGFSVGGKKNRVVEGKDKFTGRTGHVIADYSLGELSLVDNPGNPAAMISMIKSADGGELEYVLDEEIIKSQYNIFYCADDDVISIDTTDCSICGGQMKNVGSVVEEPSEIVRQTIEKAVTNAHKSPPKGFPTDRSQYADPANYKYPLDTEERIMAAFRYYNQNDQQSAGGYSDSQWASIGRKIVAALNRVSGAKYKLSNGKIVRQKGSNMDKLLNNETNDIVEDMELTSEQQETVMSKFKKMLFGMPDSEPVVDNTSPTVNYYFGTTTGSSTNDGIVYQPQGVIEKTVDSEELSEDSEDEKAVEKSADETVSDGGTEMDLEMLKDALGSLLDERFAAVKEEIAQSVDEKIEAIQKSVDETATSVEEVSEKVEKVENSGAVKKSIDNVGSEEDEVIEKNAEPSFWGNLFVPQAIVEHLGYDS